MALRKGEYVIVEVNYPRSPHLNGIWEGIVTEVGCYRSGYAYFKLNTAKYSFPNSSKYIKVLQRRRV